MRAQSIAVYISESKRPSQPSTVQQQLAAIRDKLLAAEYRERLIRKGILKP